MDKNIYIPFDYYEYIGGPATFMRNLRDYLDKNNFPYANTYKKADGIFFPIEFNLIALNAIKKRGGRIIQRLDGIWYPEKHGSAYDKKNRQVRKIYRNYTDYVIFQSKYSRRQCFAMLGEIHEDAYSLILNGVNTSIFYPTDNVRNNGKFRMITTGSFRDEEMIAPIIEALDNIKNYDFELNVVGPIKNPNLNRFLDRDYIKCHGPVNLRQVAEMLRNCDIYIFSHLNPPCPNSVLEAIATGLPVVSFDSGAMRELLWFSEELLASAPDAVFHQPDDLDPSELKVKIILAMDQYDIFSERSFMHAADYSFEKCGEKYIEAFQTALSRKPRKPKKYSFAVKDLARFILKK
jgi:glycosyltransferase involved in cell wall biosynthesis